MADSFVGPTCDCFCALHFHALLKQTERPYKVDAGDETITRSLSRLSKVTKLQPELLTHRAASLPVKRQQGTISAVMRLEVSAATPWFCGLAQKPLTVCKQMRVTMLL